MTGTHEEVNVFIKKANDRCQF